MSLVTFERSRSKFKVKTTVLSEKLPTVIDTYAKCGYLTDTGLPEVILTIQDGGLTEVCAVRVLSSLQSILRLNL